MRTPLRDRLPRHAQHLARAIARDRPGGAPRNRRGGRLAGVREAADA